MSARVDALEVPAVSSPPLPVVMLSGRGFVTGCALVAAAIVLVGRFTPMPVWLIATEVLATILGLFLFGSFRYQVHKNALTYGMLLVVVATFARLASSSWHTEIAVSGWSAWASHHLWSFAGLDDLVHADTMLFILGLTLFVSVVAQTRLLEGITFTLLRRNRGYVLPTVVSVTAVVAVASGVLDGVSMIGLTIRTLVIIMMLAAAPVEAVRYAVMVCTTVTTVCGMWLAYGEPPNLIMKANLFPLLDNAFFLRYCLPAAVATYLVVAWELRRRLRGQHIDVDRLDILDANVADVRFLQAMRHGEVITPVELVEAHAGVLEGKAERIVSRLRAGESLGLALVQEDVEVETRRLLFGHFVSEELADGLDRHYLYDAAGREEEAMQAEQTARVVLESAARDRYRAQIIGACGLIPFVILLVAHGVNHAVPLFPASFTAFAVAIAGIMHLPKMRRLALHEARAEYAEYYFLFPLFLSISLLTSAGFFAQVQTLVREGVATLGYSHVAFGQFLGSTVLSAILDNNVVADFASRGLHNLDVDVVHFFAMAQIAGYALGGCWTHIGCAQSVVAFAFIQRDVDPQYTPLQWIREITGLILRMMAVLTIIIYVEGLLLG